MILPINTEAIGKVLAGYISESVKADMKYEEKCRKEKQEKEHQKELEQTRKRAEEDWKFQCLLRFGTREDIEGYFQRTWMFDHFDHDRLCVYNPYGERKWRKFRSGYTD